MHAAKTHFSRLVEAAAGGEEIVIARAGKPVARLMPMVPLPARPNRVLGTLNAEWTVPADFDAPLPDEELAAFEGL